jgi:hypothetical protein
MGPVNLGPGDTVLAPSSSTTELRPVAHHKRTGAEFAILPVTGAPSRLDALDSFKNVKVVASGLCRMRLAPSTMTRIAEWATNAARSTYAMR